MLIVGELINASRKEKIGADGYGSNAAEAVELARRFAGAR